MNEYLLWHGTSRSAAESIIKNDFIITRGRATHGKRFGEGAYFAEQLNKSLSYCDPDNDGTRIVLLCRVCCGDMYYTEAHTDTEAHQTALRQGSSTVIANPNGTGPREFIVLGAEQVYP